MGNKPTQTTVPKLRFPEFSGNWEEKPFECVLKSINTKPYQILSSEILQDGPIPVVSQSPELISGYTANNTKIYFPPSDGVIIFGDHTTTLKFVDFPFVVGADGTKILACRNAVNRFVFHYLEATRIPQEGYKRHFSILKSVAIKLPHPDEQAKIAAFLETVDELIAAEAQKLDALKDHKKGLMQQLFPAEGKTLPKLRFPEFRNAPEWKEQPLKKFLDFQQPTAYLVSDPKYSNAYETPVLTAGKTFILGYTNEQGGIFKDNLPVIIFDDFTTATQFVDFPFKAKSSAMKILHAKNGANIKFMYEAMQMISYEVGVHARHWLSKFAPMLVLIPIDLKEQQKIADCLSSMDDLITAQSKKIKFLQDHKKGLMQQLFPNPEDMDG